MMSRIFSAFGLLSLAVLANGFASELPVESENISKSQGWSLLEEITEMAPGRQVGQPGNAAVDSWVEQTFKEFVANQNAGPQGEQVEAMDAYKRALESLKESHANLFLDEVGVMERDWSDPENLETAVKSKLTQFLLFPRPFLVVLGAALCMLVLAWWFQRRRELIWMAAGLLVLIGVVLVASWRVQSDAEAKLTVDGPDAREQFRQSIAEFLEASQRVRTSSQGNWQSGRLEYDTAAFLPGQAVLQTPLGSAPLYQLAPNLVDPANLPVSELNAPLVYLGAGGFEQLLETNLTDSLAVMEFNSGNRWLAAVEAGAKAVIFLSPPEGENLSFHQATLKTSNSPLSIPRFFMQREEADRLFGADWDAAGTSLPTAGLQQPSATWERTPVYADWIYIPGTDPSYAEELVHYQTFKDSASIVPALSPGAESAINLVAVRELLEEFSEHPPARPVLISVVNDHCNALNGEYVFSSFAFTPASALTEEIERIDFLRSQHLLVEHLYGQEPNVALLEYLRGAIERVGGRSFTVKEPAVNHLTMLRNTLRGEENLIEFKLNSEELSDSERKSLRERHVALTNEAENATAMLGLFNRFGHQTRWGELTDSQKSAVRDIFKFLADKAGREADALDAERRKIWQNLEFRNRLAGKAIAQENATSLQDVTQAVFPELPSLAAFHLDLTTGGEELGFFYLGEIRPIMRNDRFAGQRIKRLARLTLSLAEQLSAERGPDDPSLPVLRDTLLQDRGLQPEAHLGQRSDFGSRSFHQFARPALTLTATEDQRSVIYTPDDTLERLDPAKVDKLLDFVRVFFPKLTSDPQLSETVQTRGASSPFSEADPSRSVP